MNTLAATGAASTAGPARRLVGDPDVWIFIALELAMFGAFFVAYIVYWTMETEAFSASQLTVDRNLGLANTLILVISSWAVVQAVDSARSDRPERIAPFLAVGILLGFCFIAVKIIEYTAKLQAGVSLLTDTYFMFYFCLTGIHLLHVVAGTTILIVMWSNAREGRYHAGNFRGMETGASYWHMVDLLWIFLFPLLYLLR